MILPEEEEKNPFIQRKTSKIMKDKITERVYIQENFCFGHYEFFGVFLIDDDLLN